MSEEEQFLKRMQRNVQVQRQKDADMVGKLTSKDWSVDNPIDELIRFEYVNHKGITSVRRVDGRIMRMWWGVTEHHPAFGLLMSCYDLDKEDIRTFAVKNIVRYLDPE